MMRDARRIGVVLFALALAGCDYFFDGAFPEYLTRVEKRVDVGKWLPYTGSDRYSISVVDNGVEDYVVVISEDDVTGRRMVVFDSDLDYILHRDETLTSDRFYPDSPVMFDTSGNLYVGKLAFDASFNQLADAVWNPYESGYWDPGDSVFYFPYGSGGDSWSSSEHPSPADPVVAGPGGTVDGTATYSYGRSLGVFHDQRTGTAAWYLQSDDGSLVRGVVGPSTSFLSGLALPPGALMSAPGAFTVSSSFVDRLWHTADGVVVLSYEGDDEEMLLYGFDGKLEERYSLRGGEDEQTYGYSTNGKDFYILEREQEILMRARTWW